MAQLCLILIPDAEGILGGASELETVSGWREEDEGAGGSEEEEPLSSLSSVPDICLDVQKVMKENK